MDLSTLSEDQKAQLLQQLQGGQGMGLPGQNQGLTPEQKMAAGNPEAFRDYAGESAIIDDKQAQAQALRGTPTPQGRQVGKAFVAANPMEHIGAGIQQVMGGIQAKNALKEKVDLSNLKTETNKSVAADVLKKQEDQARIMRDNRRGGTAMDIMAANEQENKMNYM